VVKKRRDTSGFARAFGVGGDHARLDLQTRAVEKVRPEAVGLDDGDPDAEQTSKANLVAL
jgi:hypothetical protein